MSLQIIPRRIQKAIDDKDIGRKACFDAIWDPLCFKVAAWSGYFYVADKVIDRVAQAEPTALVLGASYAGAVGVSFLANKVFKGIAQGLENFQLSSNAEYGVFNSIRTTFTTGLSVIALVYGAQGLANIGDDFMRASESRQRSSDSHTQVYDPGANKLPAESGVRDLEVLLGNSPEEGALVDDPWQQYINADPLKGIELSEIGNIPRATLEGSLQRTSRWHKAIARAEKQFGIEMGLLAGLIMRESYGDPLCLNITGHDEKGNPISDGGAGLGQIMAGTAQDLGLNVYVPFGWKGKLPTGSSAKYGKALLEKCEELDWELIPLEQLDDRFNPDKATMATAQYLAEMYSMHHDWDKALSAYNRGPNRPLKKASTSPHVSYCRLYQQDYLERCGISGESDFVKQDVSIIDDRGLSRDLFVYRVSFGDNPTRIRDEFEEWDIGDDYKYVGTSWIEQLDGTNIKPGTLQVGQKVRVLAEPR